MGNTVGSLSEVQQQVILGCILGDGYMRKKTHAHLQITHSLKQKEYVDWKYRVLKNLVDTPPTKYRGNKGRVGYRFFTKSLPDLTVFYNKFYPKGQKRITKVIRIYPLSLAVWYMDDGSKSYKTCYFNTQGFDLASQRKLMKSLKKLGIDSSLNKDRNYYRIRIATNGARTLFRVIKPYIIDSLCYKIPI